MIENSNEYAFKNGLSNIFTCILFLKSILLICNLLIHSWHDGFSIFSVGSDGLVYKLTADKVR